MDFRSINVIDMIKLKEKEKNAKKGGEVGWGWGRKKQIISVSDFKVRVWFQHVE